jgi:hypothetical protein
MTLAEARRQRLPPGDGPGALSRLRVIGDVGEQPAQLNGGRQFALLLIGGADRGGGFLGNDKHGGQHGATGGGRQANPRQPIPGLAVEYRQLIPPRAILRVYRA